MRTIELTVNGESVTGSVEPRTHLADFLREHLNLTGTHLGCEHGVCGACTLLIDGVPARSCITLAVACEGASITTIEGLDQDPVAGALRAAFSREHGLQCGYCTPGMLVSARDTVLRMPEATEREIRIAMSGNLCRCTGYVGIVRAIERVMAERKAQDLASPVNPRTVLGPAGSGHGKARVSGDIVPAQTARRAARRTPEKAELRPEGEARTGVADDWRPQTTLQQSFTVSHGRERVWNFFGRPGDVATCLPGTMLRAPATEQHVEPLIRIKLGPVLAEFEGAADVARDASTHSGTIRGAARDRRSGSTVRGEIHYVLHEHDGDAATRVAIDVGFTLAGPLAQFSRSSLVNDIARRMTAAFAQNLQTRLSQAEGGAGAAHGTQTEAPAIDAGSLVFSVLWERMKGFFRRLFGGS